MGIFNKLFGSKAGELDDEQRFVPWTQIQSSQQLDTIWKQSMKRPQLLFKHSTRCGISRMALKKFESDYLALDSVFDVWILDLLTYRSLSQEITARTGVHHQSPQVIVINSGNAVFSDSHHGIHFPLIEEKYA